ncbi:D-alanyl-D-alanine carboxypeptidase/D-alanyl-D-alanine endopeptidase [Labilibacter marinus]|uniref:D-alanyl-D-alanine carboxypeptidase/D-alanyl-D-alanine endopeptidase n=1 Tax=Labilibacter marinus TaxID=1477105 RepID=UPI00094FFACC|nr:D-alanyl-D-alanine carboxypeptidase/D-alanyl-D-alanine-endopeptidase [Labilibacter marinus]
MRLIIFSIFIVLVGHIGNAQLNINDQGAIVGLKLKDIVTDEVILSNNESMRLIPASLTKIVTTATALEILGPSYKYNTNIYMDGEISDGILTGNIIVKSSGDPTLGSKYFNETKPEVLFSKITQILKSQGVYSITGSVVVQAEKIPYSAPRLWEDMGNYYGASPHGFNWMDNSIELTLQSKQEGSVCEIVSTNPRFYPQAIESRVVAATHNNDSAYVFGISEVDTWWVEGSIPCNRSQFNIKSAMPDPRVIFKNQLSDYIKSKGIELREQQNSLKDESTQQLLCVHSSPKLSEIIRIVNHKSNNLFADQLLLTLAKHEYGEFTWDYGRLVFENFWKDKIDYIDHFSLKDGSGLSPKNIISPHGMVALLEWMNKYSSNFNSFSESLAKGGETGTLRSVFKNPKIKGKVIGKSGSMEGVLGYCGYATTMSQKQIAFCVMTNHYLIPTKQVRMSIDSMLTSLVLEE